MYILYMLFSVNKGGIIMNNTNEEISPELKPIVYMNISVLITFFIFVTIYILYKH